MATERIAVLVDGEFAKKILKSRFRRIPSHREMMDEVGRMLGTTPASDYKLYRVFYYTAEPLSGVVRNPLDGSKLDLGATDVHRANTKLIDKLENEPFVAVRRGSLVHHGWEVKNRALRALTTGMQTSISARDIVPKINQKGVDMRIGLDLATLALKRLVAAVILVTGDSDLVPAMKLARREGLQVFLDTIGSKSIRPELKHHADFIL